MLDDLKNFAAERCSMAELVSLSAYARSLETEFQSLGVDIPEWIVINAKAVRREVKNKNAEAIASKLREAKARRSTLLTVDEKRTQLDKDIAVLEEQAKAAGVE